MEYKDLFAGKTTFTVSNGKEHYTYKVLQIQDYDRFIVKVLTGPDNTRNFTYLGMLFSTAETPVKLTQKSKFTPTSLPYKVFCFAQAALCGRIELPKGYSILPSGTCFRCGRELTTPESIKTGYGPVCGGRT